MNLRCLPLALACCVFCVLSGTTTAQTQQKPTVKKNVFFGKSKAIRDTKVVLPGPTRESKQTFANPSIEVNNEFFPVEEKGFIPEKAQQTFGEIKAKGPRLHFEGVGNVNNSWPADPNGDVGLNHYVQSVNNSTAVWDKNGELIFGPVDNETFFDAFPGPWHDLWWSDPVFIYDILADRWVFTSMSLNVNQGSYYEMIAVSVDPDPLGEYYCYAYQFENINDYPKLSLWPDGYYITYNIFEFTGKWDFLHSLATAVDRDAMLAGEEEAAMIQFIVEPSSEIAQAFTPLSADFNGTLYSENPTCPLLFAEYIQQGFPWEVNINFYEFLPDWSAPENSIFSNDTVINVEGIFPFFGVSTSAPQPGNFHDVETVNFFMMYPLTYRNFQDYQVLTGCQTLYDGEKHFIRWYEFRNDSLGWYTYQSGNYMPDGASRYMPSMAINGKGDMAMVYTKSSLDINPSICFTGRRAEDPLGVMTISELDIYKGLNYVNNLSNDDRNRWGDYASMMVDPVNDSTFWFTSMYPTEITTRGNWGTRIVAMDLTEATGMPFAFAGPDTTICGFDPFRTSAQAENYSFLLWETSGTGSFVNKHLVNTSYLRSNDDMEDGQVILSLHIEGNIPETQTSDSMTLYFQKAPVVDAGPDATICLQQSYSCQGSIAFADSYYWTCNGTGTFNDSTLIDAIYMPSAGDTNYVRLTLTLHALPVDPCAGEVTDQILLTVKSCLSINDYEELTKLNIYPNPSKGLVTLEASNIQSDACQIQVLSNSGQIIFSGDYSTRNDQLKKQYDFSLLPNGTYFFKLISERKNITTQFIKQ